MTIHKANTLNRNKKKYDFLIENLLLAIPFLYVPETFEIRYNCELAKKGQLSLSLLNQLIYKPEIHYSFSPMSTPEIFQELKLPFSLAPIGMATFKVCSPAFIIFNGI